MDGLYRKLVLEGVLCFLLYFLLLRVALGNYERVYSLNDMSDIIRVPPESIVKKGEAVSSNILYVQFEGNKVRSRSFSVREVEVLTGLVKSGEISKEEFEYLMSRSFEFEGGSFMGFVFDSIRRKGEIANLRQVRQ